MQKNNYTIVNSYIDECKTGTSIDNRNSFKQMLIDMKYNNINAVVVYKLSRISRKMKDIVNFVNYLQENNIHLITIEDHINTSSPMGVIFLYLLGIFSEMDRDNIVSNCRMGMRQRALYGLWNGGKMFGYISYKNKELEIVP